jgi:Zn-dependent peptidase ImmA (M78 family)/DNA-binding XRE family transcriptional regulator
MKDRDRTMGAQRDREQFCGKRLTVARIFNGYSQREVAQRIGVVHQFVNSLEAGRKEPTSAMTMALGDALGFEPDFFYGEPLDEFADSQCNFRRRRTTPISVRARVLAYGTLLSQFFAFARQKSISPPRDNVPVFQRGERSQIERAADKCRILWGLELNVPIRNLTRVMERAGVPVARFGNIAEKVDAFSRTGNPTFIILNNKTASRCRYDLAHECGHLVLHRNIPTGDPETEAEANHFAGALLLPKAAFIREFPRAPYGIWDSLLELKRRWRVSLAAIIRRAAELRLIGSDRYQRLYKELSARGWLRSEPGEFEEEQPEIVPLVLEEFERSYRMQRSAVATALGWKPTTFREITGLPVREAEVGEMKIISLAKVRNLKRAQTWLN